MTTDPLTEQDIINLRIAGNTYAEIAERLNLPVSTPHSVCDRYFADVVSRNKEVCNDFWRVQVVRCEHLYRSLYADISNPNTRPRDRAIAVEAAIKVMDRQARLMAMDAPIELDTDGVVVNICTKDFSVARPGDNVNVQCGPDN